MESPFSCALSKAIPRGKHLPDGKAVSRQHRAPENTVLRCLGLKVYITTVEPFFLQDQKDMVSTIACFAL